MPINLPIFAGDATALGPFLAVLIAAVGALLVDATFDREEDKHRWMLVIGVLGAALAAGTSTLWNWEHPGRTILGGALYADPFTAYFDLLFAILMGGTLMVSWRGFERSRLKAADFCALSFLSFSGMFLMNRAADMLTLFLAIELMSMPIYVLCGLAMGRKTGREAALKYFVLGSVASSIMLFGMALVYGATGSISYAGINSYLEGPGINDQLMLAGVALILSGLAFKIAAVPFHMWTPDVYEGAPTAVTTLMATGVKAAGSAAMLRFLGGAVAHMQPLWVGLIWWLAFLSMLAGNLGALRQQSIKRLLAYSSVAHAGYILLGLLAGARGSAGFAYYAFIYALTALGAFGVLQWFDDRGHELTTIDEFNGLGRQHPAIAFSMTVFLLSFAGIPPTAGFAAKFFVFAAAVQSGYVCLALMGILTSILGVYYYLKIVIAMWFAQSDHPISGSKSPAAGLLLGFLAVVLLALGLFPGALWLLSEVSTALMV